MRKIVMFNMVTVDGYFAGPHGEIDWHVVDQEFDRWAAEAIVENDTLLLGRVTYDLFANYWPGALTDPATSPDDLIVAKALHKMSKIVFSKTLDTVEWHNAKLMHDIVPEEIKELKKQKGKDIVIYGSGTIVQQLTALRLIDEYRFMVNPIVLGAGRTLFAGLEPVRNLRLLDTKPFSSGNVLLTYRTG